MLIKFVDKEGKDVVEQQRFCVCDDGLVYVADYLTEIKGIYWKVEND